MVSLLETVIRTVSPHDDLVVLGDKNAALQQQELVAQDLNLSLVIMDLVILMTTQFIS